MRKIVKQANSRFKSGKKRNKLKPSKSYVNICKDYLTLFNYRLLALFKTSYTGLHFNKNSFIAVAVDSNGNKCFLLILILHKKAWFMHDLDFLEGKYNITNKLMIEKYVNLFLLHTPPSHFAVLPPLFLNKKKNQYISDDDYIPQQLTIFRSAKLN